MQEKAAKWVEIKILFRDNAMETDAFLCKQIIQKIKNYFTHQLSLSLFKENPINYLPNYEKRKATKRGNKKEKGGVPEMPESRAREMGSSSHPLLSFAIREGNPELNLMRLALESLNWLHFLWVRGLSLSLEIWEGAEER